jgi:predicted RNase H-like HicB family nuclease
MANTMATIEFTISLNCCTRFDEDANVFVGYCPTLNVFSQGDTEEEAVEAVQDAVGMHLTTAFDFNRLDKVLRRAGFAGMSTSQSAPEPENSEFVRVAVLKDSKQHTITVPLHMSAPQGLQQYASAG